MAGTMSSVCGHRAPHKSCPRRDIHTKSSNRRMLTSAQGLKADSRLLRACLYASSLFGFPVGMTDRMMAIPRQFRHLNGRSHIHDGIEAVVVIERMVTTLPSHS